MAEKSIPEECDTEFHGETYEGHRDVKSSSIPLLQKGDKGDFSVFLWSVRMMHRLTL